MATQAHCAYCFESLVASLKKREALSLSEVEELWAKYSTEPTTTEHNDAEDTSYKPAAISRILAPSSSTSSSPASHSGVSTPSGVSEASSATSKSSSRTSLVSKLSSKTGKDTTEEHPLFVTWNTITKHGEKRLRGCIGTFSAQPLASGLSSYALTSAFDDTRFTPISSRELPSLECAVTLLTDFEPAANSMDWEVGVHGIRIAFTEEGRRYGSTYLPDVAKEQGWNKEEALVSLMRKAGWRGKESEWRSVDLAVTRYQGKKVGLGYAEWRDWRDWADEELDDE